MNRNLPYNRAERLAHEMLQVLAQAVATEVADPRVKGARITRVRMTSDLRLARISFYLHDSTPEQQEAALAGLMRAAGFLKRRIGREITLKFMPELTFFYDEKIDGVVRIEELIDSLHEREPHDD